MHGVVSAPLAARIPIILSDNPWILGIGGLIVVVFVIRHVSKKSAEDRRVGGVGVGDSASTRLAIQETEELLAQPRYREAMRLFAEDSRRPIDKPMERALQHLEQSDVDRSLAAYQLTRIITVVEAMRTVGEP